MHPCRAAARLLPAALALAAALPAAPALAQPTAALRLAFAPALGELARGVPVSDAMSSQLPVELEALWRLGRVSAGAYGSWGLGQVGADACGAGASCSASVLRTGVEALYAFDSLGSAEALPWAGIGLGWEWARHERRQLGARDRWTWSGGELAVQGGVEWRLAGRFALGPFLLLSFGRYAREALDTSAESSSASIDSRAVHAWFHVGVRGRVDLY